MANKCFLCHEEKELIDHILIHCDKTRVTWYLHVFFVWCVLGAALFNERVALKLAWVLCG